MISRTKLILSILFFAGLSWISWNTYTYFFYNGTPTIEILGVEPNSYHSQDIACMLTGRDNYKISHISIKLDNKALVHNHKINKANFNYNFTIPTKTLNNGKHILQIELESGTYAQSKNYQDISFYVDNTPLQAAFVKNISNNTNTKIPQGQTLHVQFQVNKPIKIATAHTLSNKYICVPEAKDSLVYECFIPIDCEQQPNEYTISIEIEDNTQNKLTLDSKFEVVKFPFKKRVLNLNPKKVKEENETGLSEKQLEQEIEELTAASPAEKLWNGVFYTPIDIKDKNQITTEFGVIRTTQERGLRAHKAIDVYTTPKSVVWASQDGIVVLKNRYAHSGNTVIIDHGCGILSLYFHLDEFANVQVGEKIKKGNPVGTLGKTGYATGYHLHWEMRVNNIAIDPLQWTQQNF